MRAIAQDPLQAEQVGDRGAVHRVRGAPGLAAHRRRQRRAVPGLPRGGAPSAQPRPQTSRGVRSAAQPRPRPRPPSTISHVGGHSAAWRATCNPATPHRSELPWEHVGGACRSAGSPARSTAHAQTNSFDMLPLPLGPPAISLHSKACPASARVGACIGFHSSSPGLDPRPALLHTPYHRTRRCSTAEELPQRGAPGGAGRPRGPASAPHRRRLGCCRR